MIPVIQQLAKRAGVAISIDTYKPEVMREAIHAGADIVNDVRALQEEHALEIVADSSAGVCLMHMQGSPQTMQLNPEYGDVVTEVTDFLGERLLAAEAAGITSNRIVLDPGFGFGKRTAHNPCFVARAGIAGSIRSPFVSWLVTQVGIGPAAW